VGITQQQQQQQLARSQKSSLNNSNIQKAVKTFKLKHKTNLHKKAVK
jgi:hypothetical protein